MSLSHESMHQNFFARALQRIASAFGGRLAPASAIVDEITPGQVIELSAAARAMAAASQPKAVVTPAVATQSLIGFAIVGGAVARLPLDTSGDLGPAPKVVLPSSTTPPTAKIQKLAVAQIASVTAAPTSGAQPPLPLPDALPLIRFHDRTARPEFVTRPEPTKLGTVEPAAVEAPAMSRPARDTRHILAAQRAATGALNRPAARKGSSPGTQRANGNRPAKKQSTQKKRSPQKRHVALVTRAAQPVRMPAQPAARPAAAAPAMAPITRRVDLSIPAVRGALRLEREGRNIVDSLPIAA
ncbi:MAG: hypothetical protein RL291_216 [Pseudomonadota bacterium]